VSVRVPRGRRGTTATVVALVGLVLAAALAVEALWLAVQGTTWGFEPAGVASRLRDTRLGSTEVQVVAIVVAVVGLLLLLAAALPARRHLVELDPLEADDREVATGLTRRSLRRTLTAAAVSVDGIGAAKVKVGRRRLVVQARTALRHTDGLADRVQAAVESRLADLAPRRTRAVKVRLHREED
jgi:hypothetical protein